MKEPVNLNRPNRLRKLPPGERTLLVGLPAKQAKTAIQDDGACRSAHPAGLDPVDLALGDFLPAVALVALDPEDLDPADLHPAVDRLVRAVD